MNERGKIAERVLAAGLLFLALVALSRTFVPVPASAKTDSSGVLEYVLNDDETEATIKLCAEGATSGQVTAAFDEISSGGAVNIIAIEEYAFYNCTELTHISVPAGVTNIGDNVFDNCVKLESITFSENTALKSIGMFAFTYCRALKNIEIPDSVLSIDEVAFYGCDALTRVNIPAGVISIGAEAFSECGSLTTIDVDDGNAYYGDDNGVLINLADNELICYPGGKTDAIYVIPDGVTKIAHFAFSGNANLTGVEISEDVTSIGSRAFYNCIGLSDIYIPESVTSIDEGAFYNCAGLKKVTFAENGKLKNTGAGAFRECDALESVVFPKNNVLESIDAYTFFGCDKLKDIVIPAGVTSIGHVAFQDCADLTSVIFSGNDVLKSIDVRAFFGCDSLTNIVVPDSVTSIGSYAFAGCAMENFCVPTGVTSIEENTFDACRALTRIDIPNGVTNIGGWAFRDCVALREVEIPPGVATIHDYTFSGCTALTDVRFAENSALRDIGNHSFQNCAALRSVSVPKDVLTIAHYAFAGCTNLERVNFSKNGVLQYIGYSTFEGCTALTSISIPSDVNYIGDGIPVNVEGELTYFGDGAFAGCTALSEITVAHGMVDLPIYLLTETTLANSVRIHVPRSVSSVGNMGDFVTDLPQDAVLSQNAVVVGVKPDKEADGSFIIDWAEKNDISYMEIDGEIVKEDIDDAWLRVPYQYLIKTKTSENFALKMSVIRGRLPDGLNLMQVGEIYDGLLMQSGQFYGAPLEAGEFTFTVEVRSAAFDYLLDIQEITLIVRPPDDATLARTVNDYDIETHIGASAVPGVDGEYWVKDIEERIFEIADADMNGDGGIGPEDNNFPYFVHFWIDGAVLNPSVDYDANPGSTVVTLAEKVLQDLNDERVHVAAAEFSVEGVQKVAAQNFRVDLPEESGGNPIVPSPGGDPDDDGQGGGNAQPGETEDPGESAGPGPGESPNEEESPGNKPEESKPEENKPGDNANDPGASPGEVPGDGRSETGDESSGASGDAANAVAGPASASPTGAASEVGTNNDAPGPAGATAAAGANGAPTGGTAGGSSGGAANEIGAQAGTDRIGGLPRDASGNLYFVLDDGGAPLELRIDIPFSSFENLSFDGAPWTRGTDYEAREGSTILTISAERLAAYDAGNHTIRAAFANETVSIVFLLQKTAENGTASAGDAEETSGAGGAGASGAPGIPFAARVLFALGALLLLAAALILRAQRSAAG